MAAGCSVALGVYQGLDVATLPKIQGPFFITYVTLQQQVFVSWNFLVCQVPSKSCKPILIYPILTFISWVETRSLREMYNTTSKSRKRFILLHTLDRPLTFPLVSLLVNKTK